MMTGLRIPIVRAKEIAKKYQWPQVIIIARNHEEGCYHLTTYGKNKEFCDSAKVIGDALCDVMANGPDSRASDRLCHHKDTCPKLK